jgi:hypothetical protein
MFARYLQLLALVLAAVFIQLDAGQNTALAEDGYGTITGKFVLKGKLPPRVFIIRGGRLVANGAIPKNPAVCAAKNLPSDSLIVDPKGNGIGNVFVYLLIAPKKIHPDLKAVPKKAIEFDQIGCRYVPHAALVRTGQTIHARSSDNAAHNVHTYPFSNEAENFIIPANYKKNVPMKKLAQAEPLPMKIGCDIHSWMTAYWLVLDHPYAAISVSGAPKKKGGSAIGTFKIEKLPYGTYQFRVWHEVPGWLELGAKHGFKVTVDKPEVKLEFAVPAKKFK